MAKVVKTVRRSAYGGRHTIQFGPPHNYLASIDGDNPVPVDGVTGIMDRALGVNQALMWWHTNTALRYVQEAVVKRMEEGEVFELSWMNSVLAEAKKAPRAESKVATDIGSMGHDYMEGYAEAMKEGSQEPDVPELEDEDQNEQLENACAAGRQWFDDNSVEVLETELLVFHPVLWYAGQADLIANINGELAIADYKSSKPYKTDWKGPYEKHVLQLAAYAVAIEDEKKAMGEKDYTIRHAYSVRLDKATGKVDPHHFTLSPRIKEAWRKVREVERVLTALKNIWTEQQAIS